MEGLDPATPYWLTRFCFQRALGGIYFIAFLLAANQYLPLLGANGILPARHYLRRVSFWVAPSLLWLNPSDRCITVVIWAGLGLSALVVTGISEAHGLWFSVTVWTLLWICYASLVNAGRTFYGFGWEMILIETGFLAIFLGSADTRPPVIVMYLLLWVLFRVMFGAGMIKLRADPCWRDLTCMAYHYETQPLPNPLSWYFHHLPLRVHKAAVLFNHFVELVVPFFLFVPGPLRYVAGGLTILFQVILILSGNLSWLNYITIVLCIPCFDDRFLTELLQVSPPAALVFSPFHHGAVLALALLVAILSIQPTRNLFSRRQLMNASFDPLHLVNTYGAFGSITRERMEVIIEGTAAAFPTGDAEWREYEFKGKPGDVRRRPAFVSPYHWKLDWQMWFAAMSAPSRHPWIFPFLRKLLEGDRAVLGLLAHNPFPAAPPLAVRAKLYSYRFTRPGDSRRHWWERTYVGEYLPPLTLEDLRAPSSSSIS